MFEILQGINPMGLCASFSDYKNKQYFTNMKMLPITMNYKKK